MGFDEWLQEPYQRMCAEADAYTEWCELNDLDPDDSQSEDAYNFFMAEQYDDYDHAYVEDYGFDEGWELE